MSEAADSISVGVPLTIRRRPGQKPVVTPVCQQGGTVVLMRADAAFVKTLARAFRYLRFLDEGLYASISEMAKAEKIERGYLGSLLRLTLLAPDLVEAMLGGRQPADMTLPRLLAPFPLGWAEQRAIMPGASARPEPAASG